MMKLESKVLESGLWNLARPMLFEWFLFLSIPLTDTFFLSQVSDDAAGAVGIVTPILVLSFVLIQALDIGGASIAGQYIGASKYDKAKATMGALFIFLLGVCLGAATIINISAPTVVQLMGLPDTISDLSITYLSIAAFIILGWGFSAYYKSILNIYGRPKWNAYAMILMSCVNIFCNYIVVYGAFGAPKLGLVGVAYVSVISSLIAVAFLAVVVHIKFGIELPLREALFNIRKLLRPVLKIGFPSTFEPVSFQLSLLALNTITATLGADYITAKIYVFNIFNFCLISSLSFGIANQTIIAQLVGREAFEQAYNQLFRSLKIAILVTGSIALCFLFAHRPILGLFTQNSTILGIAFTLFSISFFTEIPRTVNIVVSGSLRAAGDAFFISVSAVLVTWLLAVPLAAVLVFKFKTGILGILFAALLDEALRGIINLLRWQRKKWTTYGVAKTAERI